MVLVSSNVIIEYRPSVFPMREYRVSVPFRLSADVLLGCDSPADLPPKMNIHEFKYVFTEDNIDVYAEHTRFLPLLSHAFPRPQGDVMHPDVNLKDVFLTVISQYQEALPKIKSPEALDVLMDTLAEEFRSMVSPGFSQ